MYRLREYRDRRGHTVRSLAELSGVHYVTIVKLEAKHPKLDPQISTLLKLCKALGITLNQLVVQPKHKGGK